VTAADDTLTITGHGLVNGQTVVTSGATGGAVGVLVEDAPYFVASATTDTFQLRPSPGGVPMAFATDGTVSVDVAEAVYDAQSLRQAMGGLLYKARPTTPGSGRYNARWGVLQNASTSEVTVSGLTVSVGNLNCVIQTDGSAVRGPYIMAISAADHVLATADPSLGRIDTLIAEVLDDAADGSGDLIPGRTRVITGTPAGSPSAPATPTGALLLAHLTVPAGSTSATLDYNAPFTVAVGGILPVRNAAELPASVLREGMYADNAETNTLMRYSGSTWQGIASPDSFAATRRINTNIRTSNTATFTAETLVDSVTANLVAGATYRITWAFSAVSTVATDLVRVRLREDNVTGTVRSLGGVYISHSGQKILGRIEGEFTAASTGAKTFVGTSMRFAGTGNISHNASVNEPHYLYVDYIRG
jgi:hypothetical protein